jgi:hypothetical protein
LRQSSDPVPGVLVTHRVGESQVLIQLATYPI